jgi:HSP20 family molecular chaperone IbpA
LRVPRTVVFVSAVKEETMLHWFDTQLFAPNFGALVWPGPHSHGGWLGFHHHDTPDAVVYTLAVPGYRKKDVNVEVRGRNVIVSGERSEGFFNPSAHHSFVQSFTLPPMLDCDNVVADLRDGMLSLTVAKRPEARPRSIPIGGAQEAPQLPAGRSPSWWQRLTHRVRASPSSG